MPTSSAGSQFSRPTNSPASSEQTIGHPESTRGVGPEGGEGERGLGSTAINLLGGGKKHGNQQGGSGIGGLASSLLGGSGGSSHGGGSHGSGHGNSGGGLGGAVGQIAGSLLNSGKPQHGHNQQSAQPGHHSGVGYGSSSAPPTSQGGHGSSGGHSSGGIGGMISSALGGHSKVRIFAYTDLCSRIINRLRVATSTELRIHVYK